jgi:hypothetical protein
MFIHEPTPKPREWLHTKECLAEALIAAIENARDSDTGYSDFEFRIALQNNELLEWADDYLADGTKTCICPNKEAL